MLLTQTEDIKMSKVKNFLKKIVSKYESHSSLSSVEQYILDVEIRHQDLVRSSYISQNNDPSFFVFDENYRMGISNNELILKKRVTAGDPESDIVVIEIKRLVQKKGGLDD